MAWPDTMDTIDQTVVRAFGQAVTYTPIEGSAQAISAVFDATYQLIALGEGVEIDAVAPVLSVRPADLAASPVQGDRVTVAGKTYQVRSVHEESASMWILVLREVPA